MRNPTANSFVPLLVRNELDQEVKNRALRRSISQNPLLDYSGHIADTLNSIWDTARYTEKYRNSGVWPDIERVVMFRDKLQQYEIWSAAD